MHPIALELGPGLVIRWYGVLVALGFLTGLWTASRRGIRYGLPPETISDLGIWLLVGGLVGARFLYVITFWQEYRSGPFWEVFMLQRGGLVYYGGFLGAALVAIGYLRWKKLPLWATADALAPSIALGHVFGRLGCFMNGCCFGRVTGGAWAVHFPSPHEMQHYGVHPTQIYESFLNLLLFLALAWFYRRKRFTGQVFALYLLGYPLIRASVELLRGDYLPGQLWFGLLTPGQAVSLLLLPVGLILYFVLPRSPAPTRPTPP